MDRFEIKKKEIDLLRAKYKEQPQSFAGISYVENAQFLRNFGIIIPGKDACPEAYLKLYPSDFIVEEIANDGTVSTIQRPPSHSEDIIQKDLKGSGYKTIFATLVKCGMSTIDVIDEMARKIGCSSMDIRYAGLKDKYAITAQAISFHNIPFEKIVSLSSAHYFLKEFRFGKGGIAKGDLQGNRFSLFIRTPAPVDSTFLLEQQKKISSEGFYNFYYLQRFGTPRLINYKWGFAILQGNYKDTVVHYLSRTSDREILYFRNIRDEVKSVIPDWVAVKKIIGPYPLIMFCENKIVDHLISKPEDFIGALQTIPEQIMLWVYGLTSLLFNEMLSSHISINETLPHKLPLLLSNQVADVDLYEDLLKKVKCYPPQFYNLRPFQGIRLQHREVSCKEKVDVEVQDFSADGVAIRFRLHKGQYATTFLSHMFTFISGNPPKNISRDLKDINLLLDKTSISPTLDFFQKVNLTGKDVSWEELE